jgi:hypothetical protein
LIICLQEQRVSIGVAVEIAIVSGLRVWLPPGCSRPTTREREALSDLAFLGDLAGEGSVS